MPLSKTFDPLLSTGSIQEDAPTLLEKLLKQKLKLSVRNQASSMQTV